MNKFAMNYLISFGDDNFKYKKLTLRRDAELTGWFDTIIIDSPETISDFLNEHSDFVQTSMKGYGYWIWKPYIILKTLEKINEGDFIFYVDSGSTILKHKSSRFYEYIDILNESDKSMIVFSDSCENPTYKEKYIQKMMVLKEFSLENDQTFLNSGQVEATVFICKKSDSSISFVREWFNYLIKDNYSLVTDEDYNIQLDDFICHRHDQSILSILSKLHEDKVNFIDLIDCYGSGPFFSTRKTDHGVKENSPDGCRGEIDFDPTRNFEWKTYLSDNVVKENTINYIKTLFSNTVSKLIFGDIDFDLKKEFINEIMLELDDIQSNKGLYHIELGIYEPESLKLKKENLSGYFSCEFNIGDKYDFNFIIEENKIHFPENKLLYNKMFVNLYTRTWSS